MQIADLRKGIIAEKQAIYYYSQLKSDDGNEQRSIEHILKEEKNHLAVLEKILQKRLNQKTKPYFD